MEQRWDLRKENKEEGKKESRDNKKRSKDVPGESQEKIEKGIQLFVSY